MRIEANVSRYGGVKQLEPANPQPGISATVSAPHSPGGAGMRLKVGSQRRRLSVEEGGVSVRLGIVAEAPDVDDGLDSRSFCYGILFPLTIIEDGDPICGVGVGCVSLIHAVSGIGADFCLTAG